MADPENVKAQAEAEKSKAEARKNEAEVEKFRAQTEAEIDRTATQLSQSADRTTQLAADRTLYAAERTYAAWVRTGLAALVSGVGAKTLLTGFLPALGIRLASSVLILFSAFCFGAAIWREIFPAVPPPLTDARRIPGLYLYAVNGCLALVALFALASIWIAH